jgi:phasin family protein
VVADSQVFNQLPKETEMNNFAEQISATNKANLQAIEGLSTKAFAGMEKLVELNMASSKAVMGESFSHAQAVLGAKDVQEVMALQAGFIKPMAEKSAAYFQHVQTIAAGTGAEFNKAVESKTAELQKAFGGAVDKLAKSAPAGSEPVVAAFKSALATSQNAVETAKTTAKKAVEVAQANYNTAATQAVDAIKKATNVA